MDNMGWNKVLAFDDTHQHCFQDNMAIRKVGK